MPVCRDNKELAAIGTNSSHKYIFKKSSTPHTKALGWTVGVKQIELLPSAAVLRPLGAGCRRFRSISFIWTTGVDCVVVFEQSLRTHTFACWVSYLHANCSSYFCSNKYSQNTLLLLGMINFFAPNLYTALSLGGWFSFLLSTLDCDCIYLKVKIEICIDSKSVLLLLVIIPSKDKNLHAKCNVSTVCHKHFANRWAYNQHCASGTNRYIVDLQQSELTPRLFFALQDLCEKAGEIIPAYLWIYLLT